MTSQIAVFNLMGVAVASDSVTTVSKGRDVRTFTGAQKLFDLGPQHKAVAMTCGEARFMKVPYTVLIPQWRSTLNEPFATVEEYAESFLRWLPQRRDLLGQETQDEFFSWLVRDYYISVRSRILRHIEEAELTDASWDDPAVGRIVDEVVTGYLEALTRCGDLEEADVDADAAYVAANQDRVQEAFDYVFDDTPRTVNSDAWLLTEVPRLILSKAEDWSVDSLLAFIGYGAEDSFPGHMTLSLTGMVADRVRYSQWNKGRVTVDGESLLTPFAQSEAIDTFLRAYNKNFPGICHSAIDSLLDEISATFEMDREALTEVGDRVHEQMSEELESWSWREFISPMLDTVGSLPPPDLARMAESLVGIQALRAHSTTQMPSVGGTIALLTITPEEGVTWVRRHIEGA